MATRMPKNYSPNETEPFMNARMREYFRRKLKSWKSELLIGTRETIAGLKAGTRPHPDETDRASAETEKTIELRTRDRHRKLIGKIDTALRHLDDKTYGYCAETGDPISLKRLEARPIATLSFEAQERHEQNERIYRDD